MQSSSVDFQMLSADGKTLPLSQLHGESAGCGMYDAMGFDVCSCWSHDRRFQLLDEVTNEPLKNRLYKIICEGEVIEGHTDDNGMIKKVSADSAASVEIQIFAEGA